MQTVSSQLGQPQLQAFTPHAELVSADALGIELELEGFTADSMDRAQRLVHPHWSIIGDGSLRNGGAEFITQGGLGGTRLVAAIDKLQECLGVVNYDASWRCSTHMHVNMLDFTCNQVARFILVYAACEPVMFEFCGSYRKSSNFCTPLGDSLPFHRKLMSRMWDNAVAARAPMQHANKYVALNILPLFPDQRTGRALGTVEFRGGRPLVDRAEMLTQANLLLSMKQYVRDFVGDEEAMLNELAQGVHNTVFANGVAANIIPSVDQLEVSLVNAWALLKSYQEGVAAQRARAAEMERMGIRDEEVQAVGPSPFGRAAAPARPYQGSHQTNDTTGMQITDRDTLALLVREDLWPAIFRHMDQINDTRDPMNMLAYAFTAGTSRSASSGQSALRVRNLHVALLNWAGNCTPMSIEQSPLATLVRLRAKTSRSSPGAYDEPMSSLPAEPDTRIKPTRMMYQQLMPRTAWLDLLARIGYTSDAKNLDVWNWLAHHVVRTKGRDTLSSHVERNREGRDTDMSFESGATVSTVRFVQLLRMFALPSRDHVWTSDRTAYDNVCYVMALLNQYDCDIPYVYKRPGQVPMMIWGRGPMTSAGFGHTYTREITLRPESRNADRVTRGETLAQVTIY